jgi:hypothetical protein
MPAIYYSLIRLFQTNFQAVKKKEENNNKTRLSFEIVGACGRILYYTINFTSKEKKKGGKRDIMKEIHPAEQPALN